MTDNWIWGLFAAFAGLLGSFEQWIVRRRRESRLAGRIVVYGKVARNQDLSVDTGSLHQAFIAYEVNGKPYQLWRGISLVASPIGETIQVAYDPKRPADAMEVDLDNSGKRKFWALLGVGGLVFAAAAWMGLLG